MTDDFIINRETKELFQDCFKPCIEKFLNTRGLSLSEDKTIIAHIDEGFDFFGSM
jgi:RNA-directed DNA polymerase